MKRNRAWIAILMALCMVLTFAACSSKATSARSSDYYAKSEAAYEMDAPAAMADEAYYSEAKAAGKVSTASTTANGESANLTGNAVGRKIIKNGNLSIQTLEFEAFIDNLNQTILEMGGYVESSNINGNSFNRNSMRSANITVRIPADNLDDF